MVRHVCRCVCEEKDYNDVPEVPDSVVRQKYESASLLDLVLISILLKLLHKKLSAEEIDLHSEILELVDDQRGASGLLVGLQPQFLDPSVSLLWRHLVEAGIVTILTGVCLIRVMLRRGAPPEPLVRLGIPATLEDLQGLVFHAAAAIRI